MKKLICLLLVLSILASTTPIAFADVSSEEMIGILTSEDGRQFQILGSLMETRDCNGNTMATYRFDVPRSIMTGGSSTIYDYDGGYASTVYLTITYSMQNSPSEYLLTGVSGHWIITDPNASVESATVSYGCSAGTPADYNQYVLDAPVSNYFSIPTGFTEYILGTAFGAVLGANLTVNYIMGSTRRWSFTLQNNLINNSYSKTTF